MSSQQLAGRVTRWHTWPMIRKPSVAEHASRVATLFVQLWGIPRGEVLYYCLVHDHGEFTAGDNPYSSKELVEGLRENLNRAEAIGRDRLGIKMPEITEEEFLRFKICDLLEMFETAVVEWNMGNRYAGCVVVDCATAARSIAVKVDDLVNAREGSGIKSAACYSHITNWVHNNGYKGHMHYDVY